MHEQEPAAPMPQEELSEQELEMMELNAQRFEPLGPWQYFWMSLLYIIPGIGLIAMILQSIYARNVNRICFARSRLIVVTALVALLALVAVVLYATDSLYTTLYIIYLAVKTIIANIIENISEIL